MTRAATGLTRMPARGLASFLKFGHISPRQVWHWTLARIGADASIKEPAWAFLREIGWREFSYYLLFHFPTLLNRNWRSAFDGFPWRDDPEGFRAWSRGQTGYPMVDAGMRELWQTGWMHNRLRDDHRLVSGQAPADFVAAG